jgi:hypothetical protein
MVAEVFRIQHEWYRDDVRGGSVVEQGDGWGEASFLCTGDLA